MKYLFIVLLLITQTFAGFYPDTATIDTTDEMDSTVWSDIPDEDIAAIKTYDPDFYWLFPSENFYNSTKNENSTTIDGYNFETGSDWSTTYEKHGDMRGRDAKGNYWIYNKSSGMYFNYGTGEIRIGKGKNRIKLK